MIRDSAVDVIRARIDRRLETSLAEPPATTLAEAGRAMDATTDRWYGVLVAHSAFAVGGDSADGAWLESGVAVELLRGYLRIRAMHLDARPDQDTKSPRDETVSILAGDYLYAQAYERLSALDAEELAPAFGMLCRTSQAIVEAFADIYPRHAPHSTLDPGDVEATAGRLGAGAAAIGALCGGADRSLRDAFAGLGSDLATGRTIQAVLDDSLSIPSALETDDDRRNLRRHASQRKVAVDRALRALPDSVDVTALRILCRLSG